MTLLLSAVLIVRDEERNLADCLSSIRGVVDEIVVVDTGSVDDSVAIASSFGARLFHHEWGADFSEARNVSLEHARGEWILYIDADERLIDPDRHKLDTMLGATDAVAFRLRLRPRLDSSAYLEYRIWRNDPRIRFEGIIHETVVPAIQSVAKCDSRPIGIADLLLQHVGYEGDQGHKHTRDLPMLRRELVRNPGNLFVRHHLSRVLDALGEREEAEIVLLQALEVARRREQSGQVDQLGVLIYSDLLRYRLARGDDAGALLAEARAHYPDNCVLLWLESRVLIEQGNYELAITRLDDLLEIGARDPSLVAYEESLLNEVPHETKALCLFRLGRYAEAATEYEAAAQCAPHDHSYPVKRDLALARARTAGPG